MGRTSAVIGGAIETLPDESDEEINDLALAPPVAALWRRAMLNGVVPNQDLTNLSIDAIDLQCRLALAAAPILDHVGEQLHGTTFSLLLADRAGTVIDRRWGHARIANVLDNVGIVEGRRFTEETSGPNGIGTVLETRRGFAIVGEEHFVESLKGFACYGHPIHNPVTRTLEGVLDISCPAAESTPLLRPFVMSTARMIEQALGASTARSDQLLVESYRAAVRRRRRAPVIVLHEGAIVANASAVELLESADHAIFRELADGATSLAPQTHRLVLSSGIEVEVRLQSVKQTRGGVLFEIDRVNSHARPVSVPQRRQSSRLPAELVDARANRAPVLVAGEPGSGRSTIARAVAGDEPVQVLESGAVHAMGTEAWIEQLNELSNRPGMLLVENVHLLPDDAAHRLGALLAVGTAWIALTSGPIDSARGEFAGLVARCVARTTTVPLRRRSNEFALVVRSMLARLDADPSVRFTPETIEVLAAHTWPGNLRELADVLREVLERRSCGDVVAGDLPVAYRRGARTRRLNRVQQMEHEAIVAALRANNGSKVAAAEELGMSRSTLYRRIRTLRVPEDI
jgi:transcriptional regulator of acetoin/glycerol metabolism